MTARDDLLAAVLASDDDAPRLVYADWLEEQGEVARAQVIHLQCELARTGEHERRHRELAWELDHVLAELGDAWIHELPVLDGVEWLELHRGFASTVRVRDVATLIDQAAAIRAAAPVSRVELEGLGGAWTGEPPPWLRVLRLGPQAQVRHAVHSIAPELEVLAESYDTVSWLDREPDAPLARLSVRGSAWLGAELARRLGTAPWAAGLVSLAIPTGWDDDYDAGYGDDPRMGGDGARQLTSLRHLETLAIDGHRVGTAGMTRLVAALPALRELSACDCGWTNPKALGRAGGAPLVSLDLDGNALGNAGLAAIASSKRCAELQHLGLDTCEIESAGLAALTHAPAWHTLRSLELSRNPLGAAAARVLAEAPRPAELHELRLADADLDDRAALVLGKVGWLGQLAVLDLSGNPLGRGAGALREITPGALRVLHVAAIQLERADASALARFWPHLVELHAGNNPFGDAGIERFAVTRAAGALQALALHDCGLTDDALEMLADAARTPRLRRLDLAGNRFTARGVAKLLASPVVDRLEELNLARCALDAGAVDAIATMRVLPRLRRLVLTGNRLGPDLLLQLADADALRGIARIVLDGAPATYDREVRVRLAERFGRNWWDGF